MVTRQREFDRQGSKDLVLPTDLGALLLGIGIYAHVIFSNNRSLLRDPDTYWHIATGHWMMAERAFPRHDIFSHTALGQPWVSMEWLAQIIMAVCYDLFGWRGLIVLSALIIAFTFALLFRFLAQELRATVAFGASAVAFLFASNHFLARPHLLAYPIIVIFTALLARASSDNHRPSLWLLPLMVLWANLHGGFTLGLLLAGGFGLEATVAAPASERRRVAVQWLGFWMLLLLAGCITPYGYQYLLQTFHLFDQGAGVLRQVSELRPMNPASEINQEVVLMILLMLALTFGAKLGFVRVLMVVGLLHLSLQYVRGLALFALVMPLIVARPLQQQFPFLRATRDPFPLFEGRRLWSLRATFALLTTLVVAGVLGTAYAKMRPLDDPTENITPADALDFALKENLHGPVLNAYAYGGFLIFRGIPVFMDGRGLPFGKELVNEFFNAATNAANGDKLDELADRYKVTWTLLEAKSIAAAHFDHSPDWRKIYADDIAVIHVRRPRG